MDKLNLNSKNNMSDDEKLKLAQKLDDDLETFINGLEKRQYTEGWPEDRWQEEMEKHPFFMKKAPEPGEELHPLMQGLQELKYSTTENTPEELTNSYKEDGNFNFKHKNYRLAIIAYTEAIKIKCGNSEIEASLYNNRSAANYFLKNYRSSLRDCEVALKIKPDYDKVLIRAANCCYNSSQYQKAIDFCDGIIQKNSDCKEILNLRKMSVQALKETEKDLRKKKREESKKHLVEGELLDEIKKRRLNIEWREDCSRIEALEPQVLQLKSNRVHLNDLKQLIWPVIFLYPEYKVMDFLQEFNEEDSFSSQIEKVFGEECEWDLEKKYTPHNVNLYFENSHERKLHKVDVTKSLGDILRHQSFIILGGTPSFIILVKGSKTESDFIKSYC